MKKQIKKRILALFLALLFSCPMTANAATNANSHTIYVRAESLFDYTSCSVELLNSDERYYISEDGIHAITGLNIETERNKKVILGSKIRIEIDFGNIASKEFDGKIWYALEEAMSKVQVYIFSNGDGVLYYNSPWSNLDNLLLEIDNIMAQSYFSANMLEEMGLLADSANVVANIYDIVTNFRVNALWGGAYEEDISEQIMTLLLPMDGSSNLFSDIKSVNGKINKAAKTILKLENAYEDVREYLYDIPSGGDILLFGIEGTELLRESAEAINAANGADFADLFLRARLGYAGMKDFEESLSELKGNYLTNVHAFNLGDLVSVGEYIVDTTRISSEYALALEDVLERSDNTSGGLWSRYKRSVIINQSEEVLSDYKAYINQHYLSMFGGTVSNIFASISSNMTEDAVEKVLMGSGSLWSNLFVTALNFCTNIDKKTDAVRTMYMLGDIQSLFKDCYTNACSEGIGPEDAVFCKGAALLYLKAVWQAVDGFSFDTPIKTLEAQIESSMTVVRSFPDETFSVIANETIYPVGTFREVDGNGFLADYIGKSINEIIRQFGPGYKTGNYWGASYIGYPNCAFFLGTALDDLDNLDGNLTIHSIITGSDEPVVYQLTGAMTYPELVYTLEGKVLLDAPTYTRDADSDEPIYDLFFDYQGYSLYYSWSENPETSKSNYVFVQKTIANSEPLAISTFYPLSGLTKYYDYIDTKLVKAITYESDGSVWSEETYNYNSDGYLVDYYNHFIACSLCGTGKHIDHTFYEYDLQGNLIKETIDEYSDFSVEEPLYYTYEYNERSQLIKKSQYTYGYRYGVSSYSLQCYDTYEYDSNGRIQRVTEYSVIEDTPSLFAVDVYEYSDKGQLTRAGNWYYFYDDFGNLIEERCYTKQGEPSIYDSYYTYEYNSAGKLLRRNTCCNCSFINGRYIYSLDIVEITEITTYI